MARLAAYYQEDFHYAPVGYGTRQKKAAYIVHDPPQNNLLLNNYANGGSRLRALGSSEPSLSPTYTYAPKTAVMTLKAKPRPINNKLIEQSRMAVQRLERMYEPAQCNTNPYAVARLEPDSFDCESVYSQGGRSAYDETYVKRRHKSKDQICNRMSYDLCDNYQTSTSVRNLARYHDSPHMHVQCVDTINGESFPVQETCTGNCEECVMPPVSFRSDSSHGRWQQWPWNMVDTQTNPALLSPPSPLDSGLSSQSITSSPSLEAEPMPVHPGQIQIIRPDSHHICSCPQAYSEPSRIMSPPGRYDSGRSSPGAYITLTKNKKSGRKKDRKIIDNGIVYLENEFEDDYGREQVRYGRLGLIGEPVPQLVPTLVKATNGNCHRSEYIQNSINNNSIPPVCYYTKDNSMTVKRCDSCPPSKHSKSQTNYLRPTVVITEASDKSNPPSLDSTLTPDPENSIKSPEPDSSISTEVSNPTSNSSSVASSGNDLESEEQRRKSSKKKTEKEIRELEDMYKKCNLSDNDLLERAERRDLPTAHQTRSDQSLPTLTRSKSDTLYETYNYYNPYESPYRAPPLRRSGIPDIIGDDMALRKNCKPVTTSTFNPAENTVTYMLCSSHFTPTVSNGKDILLMDNPDIEYDDLSYRKHYFGKKSKIPDPQPPFGIPLRPPPPQSMFSDYLHVVPTNGLKPLCHPRGNPDVVRDDMAFRTLRKDEQPNRLYYDSTEVFRKKKKG